LADQDEWLTISEAAERLKVSRRMLYRYMNAGELPYYQVGSSGRRRIKKADLEALLVPGIMRGLSETQESQAVAQKALIQHQAEEEATSYRAAQSGGSQGL